MSKAINDVSVMSLRCLRLTFRNVETMVGNTVTPLMFLFLFVYVFGSGAADMGVFINAQVPSVLVAVLCTSAAYSAFSVNADMQSGVIDRFRSMPMFGAAVLAGHVVSSFVRCLMGLAVAVATAFLVGFRPQAGVVEWFLAGLIMFFAALVLIWIFIFVGLTAENAEGTSSYSMPIQFLPFLSGGFADPDYLVLPLGLFFRYQPFTPIIVALRGLMAGVVDTDGILLAVIWCLGLTVLFYCLSVRAYRVRNLS